VHSYGKELLNELAARLTGEFGNGFSVSSLKVYAPVLLGLPRSVSHQFARTLSGEFPAFPIHQTLSGELQTTANTTS